jgi:tetratricopeptide (TPR) repeat protein
MKLSILAVTLAATSTMTVDTNRLAQVYEEGIRLYWSGDIKASALKMVDVMDQSPRQGLGNRAEYMLGILEAKLGSNDTAGLRAELHKRYPIIATFTEAQRGLTNPPMEGFSRMVDFAVVAPTPAWRRCALQALFAQDWSNEVIAGRLEAATLLADLADESAYTDNPPRLQRLHGQLLREYIARADYPRQIQLRERALKQDLSPEAVMALVNVYRTAGKPDEAFACYTNMLMRAPDPAALACAMTRSVFAAGDHAAARASLAVARTVVGSTNAALRVVESRMLEETYDYKAAAAIIEGDDPDLKRAREELRLRLPTHYELVWNVGVTGAIDVATDSLGYAHVAVNFFRTTPGAVALLNRQGETVRVLQLTMGGNRPNFNQAQIPFLLMPDGGYLIGWTLYFANGEVRQALDLGQQQNFPRLDGSAAYSPSEGIVLATSWSGISRYGRDLQPVFKARDPEIVRQPYCSVVWIGTNFALVDFGKVTTYDNQGIRIRTLDLALGTQTQRYGFPSASGGRVTTDAEGVIYFASPSFRGVRIYDPDFRLLTHIPMANAESCAAAPDGSVYVLHDGQIAHFVPKDGGARALMRKLKGP